MLRGLLTVARRPSLCRGARSAPSAPSALGARSYATFDVKTPEVAETITEGEILGKIDVDGRPAFATEGSSIEDLACFIKEGDAVHEDQVVALMNTEKVTVKVLSNVNGVISKFLVQPGATVKTPGQPIMRIRLS